MVVGGTRICNLTASAYRHGDGESVRLNPVLTHGSLSAEIVTATGAAPFEQGPVDRDIFYVVIAGFGVLQDGAGAEVDFTAGDLLFVPAGIDRRFSKLSSKFQTWRIMLSCGAPQVRLELAL